MCWPYWNPTLNIRELRLVKCRIICQLTCYATCFFNFIFSGNKSDSRLNVRPYFCVITTYRVRVQTLDFSTECVCHSPQLLNVDSSIARSIKSLPFPSTFAGHHKDLPYIVWDTDIFKWTTDTPGVVFMILIENYFWTFEESLKYK